MPLAAGHALALQRMPRTEHLTCMVPKSTCSMRTASSCMGSLLSQQGTTILPTAPSQWMIQNMARP